jgi:hypothetical protein
MLLTWLLLHQLRARGVVLLCPLLERHLLTQMLLRFLLRLQCPLQSFAAAGPSLRFLAGCATRAVER